MRPKLDDLYPLLIIIAIAVVLILSGTAYEIIIRLTEPSQPELLEQVNTPPGWHPVAEIDGYIWLCVDNYSNYKRCRLTITNEDAKPIE